MSNYDTVDHPMWCSGDHSDWNGHHSPLHSVPVIDDRFLLGVTHYPDDPEPVVELAGSNGHMFLLTRAQVRELVGTLTAVANHIG